VRYEGLSTFVPPPYLTSMHDHHPKLFRRMEQLDAATCAWPVLRNIGDHFLIVLRRR